ncbi:MAG: DUF3455 domain-containing protein [Myxococcaceae bacterium]
MKRIICSLAVVFGACAVPAQSPASQAPVASTEQGLSKSDCPSNVPAALVPAADQALYKVFAAEGVQIYRCTANATGAAWVFDSPDALLLKNDECDDDGDMKIVGHHFAGPTWEYKDRSQVVGAKVAGATVDATAIPWLLLNAVSHTGAGAFAQVTSIQRLNTVGGNAPSTGCDATTVGAVARVPYTATYFMYRTRSGDNSNRQCN